MSSELVAVVAAIKADGKRTSPDDVLAQVHATGPQWADVTLSQVRRAITAAKAAAPQLDAESQAERRKVSERARDQNRDRSERANDGERRVQRRRDAKEDERQAIDDRDIAALEYELSQSTLRLSTLHTIEKQDGWHDTLVSGIACTHSGELLLCCQRDPWMWSLVRPSERLAVCGGRTPEHFILVLSETGNVVGTIGEYHGTGEATLDKPSSVACDENYVYITSRNRVQQFNFASRAFVKSVTLSQNPRSLHAVGQQVFVTTRPGFTQSGDLADRNARIHVLGSDMVIARSFNVVRWPPPLDVRDKPTDPTPDWEYKSSVEAIGLCSQGDDLFVMVHGSYNLKSQPCSYPTDCYHIQVFSISSGSFIRAIRLPNGSKRWRSDDDPLQGFRCGPPMTIVQSSARDKPVLAVCGSRPFGEWGNLIQILLLELDGTPIDRMRVVPSPGGICSLGSVLYVAANGYYAVRPSQSKGWGGGPKACLPCQLQHGVATLRL